MYNMADLYMNDLIQLTFGFSFSPVCEILHLPCLFALSTNIAQVQGLVVTKWLQNMITYIYFLGVENYVP